MSDLINSDSMHDEREPEEQDEHSTWSMMFTMLLMTGGFLFAGGLLIQQTLSATNKDGAPLFQWSQMVEQARAMRARPEVSEPAGEEAAAEPHSQSSTIEEIKKIVSFAPTDSVRWPRLKLTGFGKSTDGAESFAIINGDLVHAGEYTGKVKLVEIRTHDVVVEYKGEQKTLTVQH